MKSLRTVMAVAALGAICSAGPSHAQETTLLLSLIVPPTSDFATRSIVPWATHVNQVGKGVVHLDVRPEPTLANPGNFYDRVMNDVVQVAWGTQSQVGGRFPLSDIMGLPFETDKSEDASVAFYRLYKTGLLDAEYADVVPLFVYSYPQNGLHFAKRPPSLDNLSGQKIQAINRTNAEIVSRMGAAPVTMHIAETHPSLHRGTIDATILPWSAFQPFKLAEVTSFHLEAPLGAGPGMFFMAKKKYQALNPQVRRILDENSGEKRARSWGAFLDVLANEGRSNVQGAGRGQADGRELDARPVREMESGAGADHPRMDGEDTRRRESAHDLPRSASEGEGRQLGLTRAPASPRWSGRPWRCRTSRAAPPPWPGRPPPRACRGTARRARPASSGCRA